MRHTTICLLAGLFTLTLTACAAPQAQATLPAKIMTLTAHDPLTTPTSPADRNVATCADLDTAWTAADWPLVLNILQQLKTAPQPCGGDALEAKLYAAHFNYASTLEANGERTQAIEHYRAALAANARGREAIEALVRLNALPTLPPPPCQPSKVAPYSLEQQGDFITIAGRGFTLSSQPFYLRGLNYYPRHAPWEKFLTNSDLTEVKRELDLIAQAGFNTLRIALWYDPLFTCAPEDAVPNATGFAKLDALIASAQERGLHLIVTLNDLPDLYFRPLYTDYARYDAQTVFIVQRYRDEPAILAWDMRNEADLDYGADGRPALVTSEVVLKWLAHITEIVRKNDQHHLITVGWWGDVAVTNDVVDFLSFHHWTDAASLAERIISLRSKTTKPIVLEEVGYPAWDQTSEAAQARSLKQAADAAETNGTAGWLIWTAFDFTPPPEPTSNQEYFFGLWRVDLTPKSVMTSHLLPMSK